MPLSNTIQCRLKSQHESLSGIIRGLTEAQLREPVKPGKWSAFENIAHLVAYQPTFLERLRKIAHEDSPLFDRYTADHDPLFRECCRHGLPELLEDLQTQRFLINNHLMQLNETGLRRQGIHPLYGKFDVTQWSEFFLLHEAHHLFTVFTLTAGTRVAAEL